MVSSWQFLQNSHMLTAYFAFTRVWRIPSKSCERITGPASRVLTEAIYIYFIIIINVKIRLRAFRPNHSRYIHDRWGFAIVKATHRRVLSENFLSSELCIQISSLANRCVLIAVPTAVSGRGVCGPMARHTPVRVPTAYSLQNYVNAYFLHLARGVLIAAPHGK